MTKSEAMEWIEWMYGCEMQDMRCKTCEQTEVCSEYVDRRTAWNGHCGIQLYVRCYVRYKCTGNGTG